MYTILKNRDNNAECVYNLIESNVVSAPPPPRYRSRYSCFVRQESACNKSGCYRTMGLPKYHQCPPDNFLRKQSRAPISVLPSSGIKTCTSGGDNCGQLICQPTQTDPEASATEADTTSSPMEPGSAEEEECTQGISCGPAELICPTPINTTTKNKVPRICCNVEKPPVPLSSCGFGVIPRGCKDFVRDNAIKVVRQPARIPAAQIVDMPNGHRFNWCTSGYPRHFVCKEDYGSIPSYLVQRNKELIDREKQMKCEMEERDEAARAACRHLEEDERSELLCGLKAHWADTFREFQMLPLKIDTQGKIKRKAELEQELKTLEKDIQLLERHNHIFLAKNANKSFYLAP